MKIGVVSDTHLSNKMIKLPDALKRGLHGVDFILHAGDWTSPHVYDMFNEIAPCDGIAGNNDGFDIITRFGNKKMIELDGIRIGIVHGHGNHVNTVIGAQIAFQGENPDVIIFGHTHIPYHAYDRGILLFNPGSPTDKRREELYSYGIIKIDHGIQAWHEYYSDKS